MYCEEKRCLMSGLNLNFVAMYNLQVRQTRLFCHSNQKRFSVHAILSENFSCVLRNLGSLSAEFGNSYYVIIPVEVNKKKINF